MSTVIDINKDQTILHRSKSNVNFKLDTELGAPSNFGLIKELISQNVTKINQRAGLHVGKKFKR